MKENQRKCFKCGSSPAEDSNIVLYRFPKPGKTNILRCELWAKYCFPIGRWSSPDFQRKLHDEHRMLCHKHFRQTSFIDFYKKKLHRHAAPHNECDESTKETTVSSIVEPIAGPSGISQPLANVTNIACNTLEERTKLEMIPQIVLQQSNEFEKNIRRPGLNNLTKIVPRLSYQSSISATSPKDDKAVTKQCTKAEENIYLKCNKYMKKICQLRNRIYRLKNKIIVKELANNASLEKLSKNLTPTFACMLQAQIKNFKKKVNGRRWQIDEKIIALRLFKRSPTCYRLLRRLFYLPSPSTLKFLLRKFSLQVGISPDISNVIKKFIKTQDPINNQYILMFDEMSIKKKLFYNQHDDIIEGFQDHGSQGRTAVIASHALVFMVAGIRKKLKQPIAFYFSSGYVTADRLAVLLKEVLHHCFEMGLVISATVCDMDGVNRRALGILGATVQSPKITVHDKEVITLFDPPHLLKCFRNLFMKYDIKGKVNMSSGNTMGIAKWEHIKQFYQLDNNNPNFVFAPALKDEHLNPNTKQKMKVKLAAQVLSHSVAAGMFAKISQGQLTTEAVITATVVSNIDKLFDSVNSDSPDLRRGKPFSTNLKESSPHLKLFKEMTEFFSTLEFLGSRSMPPSLEGWIWTLKAIESLWQNLKKYSEIKSLATRRLQQDPLENLFGCIRGNCGASNNPTVGQFVAGIKTAILSNLSHIGGAGNCELDNNDTILDNFRNILSNSRNSTLLSKDNSSSTNFNNQFELIDNEEDGEVQACAYVCGFILKHMNNKDCHTCRKILLSEEKHVAHIFVSFKEDSDEKESLTYSSKELISCVEKLATISNNYFAKEGHTTKIKERVTLIMKNSTNFDFLSSCAIHYEENIDYIVRSVFFICIKRFCNLKNREFSKETSASTLKKKLSILQHK